MQAAKFVTKIASGHIVAYNDSNYIILTARTNLHYSPDGDLCIEDAIDGFFFLQKTGQKDYLAQFQFKANNIHHYKDELSPDEQIHLDGSNLSAIIPYFTSCNGQEQFIP